MSISAKAPSSPAPAHPMALSAEDKEKKLAEARMLAAHRLQRKQRLQLLVHKRKTNLAYLKVQTTNVHFNLCIHILYTIYIYKFMILSRKFTRAIAIG
jgi:hypothetical protein